MRNTRSWEEAEALAASSREAGFAVVALDWDLLERPHAISDTDPVNMLADSLHAAVVPGAHVALWTPGVRVGPGGLALRLSGFEIRDTVCVAVGDDISYWIIGRKALEKNVAETVLRYGAGGLNINATRVTAGPRLEEAEGVTDEGRYSPNLVIDDAAARSIDKPAPDAGAGGPASGPTQSGESKSNSMQGKFKGMGSRAAAYHGDAGGASRFFPRIDNDLGAAWILSLVETPERPGIVMVDESLGQALAAKGYQRA